MIRLWKRPRVPQRLSARRLERDWYDITSLFVGVLGFCSVVFTIIHTLDSEVKNDRDTAQAIAAMRNIATEMRKDRPLLNKEASAAADAAEAAKASAQFAGSQALALRDSVDVARAGAAASAAAADASALQAAAARVVPFEQAIYAARLAAIAEYARSSANLSSVLGRTAILVPIEAESPTTLRKMSDAELLKAAQVARPAIRAWQEYIASSSAVAAPWSTRIDEATQRAEQSGRRAYECFRWLGAYVDGEPIPADWWNRIRNEGAEYCDGFKHQVNERKFDFDARLVLRAMTDELREGDQQFVPGRPHPFMD